MDTEMNQQRITERPIAHASDDSSREQELAQVREALAGLSYGEVSIIVQDGVIVQIVRTEKRRIRKAKG
jgi:hypothetical protein